MQRTPIVVDPQQFPTQFQELLSDSTVFDSSCSSEARVYFIDKDAGFYLKTAPKGALEAEAMLTRFFHENGLAPEVLAYEQADSD